MSRNSRRGSRPGAGRGATLILASLLMASGGLRLGLGADRAMAEVEEAFPAPERGSETKDPEQSASSHTVDDARDRAEIAALLEALTAREAQITKREQQLEARRKALEIADEEVRKRLADLAEMEEQLRQTLTLADGAAEDDLARLTTVYETMKPKNAAALFETMEPAFAAGFLGRMRPDAAAAIMAGLTPETAYTISVIMAGRNAQAPKT